MHTCSYCKRELHTSQRITGDVISCPCGASYLVRHTIAGTAVIELWGSFAGPLAWPSLEEPKEKAGDDE